MARPRILVSLHDVWPGNYVRVDRDLQWLRERGVRHPAILAVPRYHGAGPMEEEPAFLEWLRGQARAGASLFAHGLRHKRAEACGEPMLRSWLGAWMNRRVADEAEFAGLSNSDTARLLDRSFLHFRKSGIEPAGFAFPAWMGRLPRGYILPPSCRILDGRFTVAAIGKGAKWAPALTFGRDAAGRLFAYGGKVWGQYLSRAALIRIALHPGDLDSEAARNRVETLLRRGEAISYEAAF